MILFADEGWTPQGWAVIIAAIFLGVAKIVSMVLDYMRARDIAAKVEEVAVKVDEKTTLQDAKMDGLVAKVEEVAEVGVATHKLCNSAMLEQKHMLMVKCDAAERADPSEINVAEAMAAREAYAKHAAAQRVIDNKKEK